MYDLNSFGGRHNSRLNYHFYCRFEELQQKTCETLQFIHDIRPEKAGSRTTRPSLPVTEEQKLALGGLKNDVALWPDCPMLTLQRIKLQPTL